MTFPYVDWERVSAFYETAPSFSSAEFEIGKQGRKARVRCEIIPCYYTGDARLGRISINGAVWAAPVILTAPSDELQAFNPAYPKRVREASLRPLPDIGGATIRDFAALVNAAFRAVRADAEAKRIAA